MSLKESKSRWWSRITDSVLKTGSNESLNSWHSLQSKRKIFGNSKFSSLKRSFSLRTNKDQENLKDSSRLSLPNMERNQKLEMSGTQPDLTPIVLNQLQTATKLKEENKKLRRGSRSSQNSTPGHITVNDRSGGNSCTNGNIERLDSESESCGEDSHRRTAEAFMSGIQSAISASIQSQDGIKIHPDSISVGNNPNAIGVGLSPELIGEVNSVLSKLMTSLNTCDPSLIPLITNLQTSLKATVNTNPETLIPSQLSNGSKKDEVLSEFSHNENSFFGDLNPDNKIYTTSKIPWKIRAARKRATKHHTTGMTKEEFARIKKSIDESGIDFSSGPTKSYALTRNKSEGAILHQQRSVAEGRNVVPTNYKTVEGHSDSTAAGNSELGYASDVCDYNMTSKGNNNQTVSTGRPLRDDNSYVQQKRPVSMENEIQSRNGDDLRSHNRTPSQGRSSRQSNSGVRTKIARRKMMKKSDTGQTGTSDQESSEFCDDEDSVEEKHDSEPINDHQSMKPKTVNNLVQEFSNNSADWTPETARRNWNNRFADIKHSFDAASEEDLLSKSRSPSLYQLPNEVETRGGNKFRSISPVKKPFQGNQDVPLRMTPGIERAQSKEDKNKLNAAMTAHGSNKISDSETVGPLVNVSATNNKWSGPDTYAQSKSKQPTPNRDTVSSGRLSKSVPREGYDDHRAEVLGLVKAGRTNEGSSSKSSDMDYQEYMNIINKVRKSKELERMRTEQLRLASMYAREKKRQEELKKEEERLKQERIKIDAEKNQAAVSTTTTNQKNTEVTISPNVRNGDENKPQEIEKGQLDNVEAESMKLSPQRKMSDETIEQNVIVSTANEPKAFAPNSNISPLQNSPITTAGVQAVPSNPANVTITNEAQEKRSVREEQLRMEQLWLEQREQQVKLEQENLERLREEQLKQEKEREEIRRLEVERLRQIQEEQRRLEAERRRQEEHMRLEQLRLEEERRRQEKLQAEKNAEYNRQRLDIEAKNIAAMQEEQRAARERIRLKEQQLHLQQHAFSDNYFASQEKIIHERLLKQDKLREEHKREEAKIRQEKLNLINQEEMLIRRQEDMLKQIEAERENLSKQEQLIRQRQQDRLKQVRQEKVLLEKQEETLRMREQQLITEKVRQEKLREEQRILREQEEAIRRRQEEISKELMEELTADITVCEAREGQVFMGPQKPLFIPNSGYNMQLSPRNERTYLDSKASTSPPPLQYVDPVGISSAEMAQVEEDEEGSYYSGSETDEDTLDEDGYYESKVEVKQNATSIPTTVRTIETKLDNPPWAPVTPYLCYSDKHASSQTQEEISEIFSQAKFTKPGVITSPESLRTSTNLITTPESSISLQSRASQAETRQSSYSPPALPPLPTDEVQTDLFLPVQPDVPPRRDSFSVCSSTADSALSLSISETTNKKDLLDTPTSTSSNSQLSPRLGGPGSAFKPYASSENLFDPMATKSIHDLPPLAPIQNYPLRNGDHKDSRLLIRSNTGGKEDYRGHLHGKVRELRRQQVKPPFSTTDTEPEMRECNLSTLESRKKGNKKQVVYSTSETEEEYQAYMRIKPKWHGKGGHKDSWDPLLIQSPPQITQKPLGIIPKPQAALAVPQPLEIPQSSSMQSFAPVPVSTPHYAPPSFSATSNSSDSLASVIKVSSSKSLSHHDLQESDSSKSAQSQMRSDSFQSSTSQIRPSQTKVPLPPPLPAAPPISAVEVSSTPVTVSSFKETKSVNRMQVQVPEKKEEKSIDEKEQVKNRAPSTERVLKSDSIIEIKRMEQSLPQSVAEINRKSFVENQERLSISSKSKTSDSDTPSLSSIMKQSLNEKSKPNSNASLNHSTVAPPFMTQQIKNEFAEPPFNKLYQASYLTPTSKLVSEMDKEIKKEGSPFLVKSSNSPQSNEHQHGSQEKLKVTPQRELQQKLMTEALQRIGDKRDNFKKSFNKPTRANPTIAAMEIMTRKELKQGEMEQRLARGEVPEIPVPVTPLHMKHQKMQEEKAEAEPKSLPKSKNKAMLELLEQQTLKMRKSLEPMPQSKTVNATKKLSVPNPEPEFEPPVILLKKEPKRLRPEEIKARNKEREMQEKSSKSQVPAKDEKSAPNVDEKKIGAQSKDQRQLEMRKVPEVKKPSNAEKIAEAMKASKAQTVPKNLSQSKKPADTGSKRADRLRTPPQTPTKPLAEVKPLGKDSKYEDTSESEYSRGDSVKKAAEKFEKVAEGSSKRAPPPPLSSLGSKGRSKSIGHSLAQKLQEVEEEPVRPVLPWAVENGSEDQSHHYGKSAAPVQRRFAMRNKGYELRMSKSSDSITAAKLLAEARMKNRSGLRINQDMSKSIEKQIDVYTKTKEEIRKILEVAKTSSVTDRIKLFDSQTIFHDDFDEERAREEKAEKIRREILELKAQSKNESSRPEPEIQSPIDSKVKPLKIPSKPRIVEGVRPQLGVPGATLRINQSSNPKTSPLPPEVRSILRTSRSTERNDVGPRRGSLENIGSVRSRIESYVNAADEIRDQDTAEQSSSHSGTSNLRSILMNSASKNRKKSPKLVHSGGPMKIYTQSATDYSEEDEELAHRNRQSQPHLLQIPELPEKSNFNSGGVRKSKSFAATSPYECVLNEQEASEKKKTMMAYFAQDIKAQARVKSRPVEEPRRKFESEDKSLVTVRRNEFSRVEKRGSVISLSDEILGDEDMGDVEAVFESLLNNTFEEKGRHASRRDASGGKSASKQSARSKSEHAGGKRKSARNSSVTRKPSKNKLVAGEVKAVFQDSASQHQRHATSSSMLSAHIEQKKAGEEAVFRKINDPVAALPTSHTKKYLPRQQTWGNGSGSPSPNLGSAQGNTPSPTPSVSTRHGHSKQVTSPFDKFRDLENQSHATSTVSPGRLTRQASLPSVSAPPPVQQPQPQPQQSGNNLTQKRSFMSRSPSSTKELLLMWVQQRTNSYPNLNVTNFSSSWSDGLAFCALIHYYYPEAFDFDKLDPKNRRENFELAFTTAEDYAGICPLLDVEDMMIMSKPDWKCVFTYVQSFYRRFRNGRDPPPPTRPLTLQPEETQVSPNLFPINETPISEEKQKSLLSKYMIDDQDEEDKRQKFRTSKSRPQYSASFSEKDLLRPTVLTLSNKPRPKLTSSLSLSSYPTKADDNKGRKLSLVEENDSSESTNSSQTKQCSAVNLENE